MHQHLNNGNIINVASPFTRETHRFSTNAIIQNFTKFYKQMLNVNARCMQQSSTLCADSTDQFLSINNVFFTNLNKLD